MQSNRIPGIVLAVFLSAAAGLVAAGASTAASESTTAEDIKQETVQLLQALESYGAEQRDEALSRSRAALEKIDRRIDGLESRMLEKWNDMDQAAREQARASLQALREQRTRVAESYGSMKSASAGAWGHIKEGFSKAYQSLQEAWEKSEREFGSGEAQ
jgi:flagellar biosynthesis GTPase FlhF